MAELSKEVKGQLAEVESMAGQVSVWPVTSPEQYRAAAEALKRLKGYQKTLDETRKEATKPLDEAKDTIMGWFRPAQEKVKSAIAHLAEAMISWDSKIAREREEAERRAREQEEKERAKIQKGIDKAIEKGDLGKAETLQAKQESVQVAVAAPASPEKQEGLAISETFFAVVVDFKALPDEYKLANQSMLDKVAKATKGKAAIPGVKFESKKAVRGVRA